MVTPERKENGAGFQKRIATALKAAGYSLKGCQLVLTDFQILESVMQEEDKDLSRERVELYLHLCRNTRIQPSFESGYNHEFVDDTRSNKLGYVRLKEAREARWYRRLNRTCANTCCLC